MIVLYRVKALFPREMSGGSLTKMSGESYGRGSGGSQEQETPRLADCNRCGENGLSWKSVQGKWRLFKGSKAHMCLQACKFCGEAGMRWGETARGWRLHSDVTGKVHLCQARKQNGGMPPVEGQGRPDGMPF